jgi:hypothetical protein
MKVARNLAPHEFLNLLPHPDVSIARDEPAAICMQISICKKMASSCMRLPKAGKQLYKNGDAPFRSAGCAAGPLALGNRLGGVMRIGRVIIIPAIVTLGVTGSILVGPAISVAAGHAPVAHVLADSSSAAPGIYYHM